MICFVNLRYFMFVMFIKMRNANANFTLKVCLHNLWIFNKNIVLNRYQGLKSLIALLLQIAIIKFKKKTFFVLNRFLRKYTLL